MDILFVANWSAPGIVGANYASSGIHFELSKRNLEIGVLSSLIGHQNLDIGANQLVIEGQNLIELKTNSITYLLPSLPKGWSARHINNSNWDKAVTWGISLLKKYNPKVVHIQQWQNFWWMAEAASKCSIPYNYTPYDFGLICARTVLIRSDGSRCEGVVSQEECASCIYNGRGFTGKLNENLIRIPFLSNFFKLIAETFPHLRLYEKGIVLDPIYQRLVNDRNRLSNFLANLDTLIVNSNFSKNLFLSRGDITNIRQIPWFHNLKFSNQSHTDISHLSTIGFVGRISPEKGLDILLESLRIINDNNSLSIKLLVAGDATSQYALNLKKKYCDLEINWIGWVDASSLTEIYDQLDLLVVPSISYDNGPITIMEAIATKTPVLVSNNDTLLTYLSQIKSEHSFESGSPYSLAKLIMKYARNPHLIVDYISELPEPMTVEKYVDQLMLIYNRQLPRR